MSYAYSQDVPIDESTYRRIIDRLGPAPIDGLIVHLALRRPEGGLRYIDVWESLEACERGFNERIHPAVYATFSDIGFTPNGEPEKHDLEVIDIAVARA